MRRKLSRLRFALALALALAAGAASATQPDQALAALRAAADAHPDDADRSWALAAALEATGRYAEAADAMQQHLERWPKRPAEGWRALGRSAYRAGRGDDAIPALERALAHDAHDAEAHLYLGLALQQQGEMQGAEEHFEAVAAGDPKLAPQALLLSGMSHIARGDTRGGHDRLERILEIAPLSRSARDARSLLDDTAPKPSPFRVETSAGASYDSNVTLGGEGDYPGAGQAKDDALFDFGTEFAWRPTFGGERSPVELAVRYDRLDYAYQTEFSEQRFEGSASTQLPLHRRAALRIDAAGGYTLLENDPYLLSGALRPSLLVALGKRAGLVRVHAGGERLAYEDEPLFESLERSGWAYGGGVEHLLPFRTGGERQGWLAWGSSYQRRDTEAGRDELGFGGAYDSDRWRGSLRTSFTLPFELRARAELAFDAEIYDHRNVLDLLTTDSLSPERRRDLVWSSGLSLRRPLFRGVDLEVYGSFSDRDSNIDAFTYQRGLTGLRFHAALP